MLHFGLEHSHKVTLTVEELFYLGLFFFQLLCVTFVESLQIKAKVVLFLKL